MSSVLLGFIPVCEVSAPTQPQQITFKTLILCLSKMILSAHVRKGRVLF